MHRVRILGLDPGLQHTGYGIIDQDGNRLSYVAHGTIDTKSSSPLPQRLAYIHTQLKAVIEKYQPDEAAVEETFINANPRSALKLGMARGVIVMTPAYFGLPTAEYAANRVKKSVVGVGHADKNQVAHMVQRLLPGCGVVVDDAADALAVALCHGHYRHLDVLTQDLRSPGVRASR